MIGKSFYQGLQLCRLSRSRELDTLLNVSLESLDRYLEKLLLMLVDLGDGVCRLDGTLELFNS